MAHIVVALSIGREITKFGFDGREFNFQFNIIDAIYVGTPQESLNKKCVHINVDMPRTLILARNISNSDVEKVLFEFAKEYLGCLLVEAGGVDIPQENNFSVGTHARLDSCIDDIKCILYPPAWPIDFII